MDPPHEEATRCIAHQPGRNTDVRKRGNHRKNVLSKPSGPPTLFLRPDHTLFAQFDARGSCSARREIKMVEVERGRSYHNRASTVLIPSAPCYHMQLNATKCRCRLANARACSWAEVRCCLATSCLDYQTCCRSWGSSWAC